jgi:hypothetical protein
MTPKSQVGALFQSLSEHIATHLATKTEPVTIFIKIDYRVVHRFEPGIVSAGVSIQYTVRDLLKSQHESKVRTIDPASQNIPCKMSTGDNSPVGEYLKTY